MDCLSVDCNQMGSVLGLHFKLKGQPSVQRAV